MNASSCRRWLMLVSAAVVGVTAACVIFEQEESGSALRAARSSLNGASSVPPLARRALVTPSSEEKRSGSRERVQAAPPVLAAVRTPAPAQRTAASATNAGDETAVEDQTITPEIMGNPEIYNPGPGPYVAQYDGRSGAIPAHVKPADANITTVVDSAGPFPKLAVWVPSFRVGANERVMLNASLTDERGSPVRAESVSFAMMERGSSAAPVQGTLEPVSGAPGHYARALEPRAGEKAVVAYEYVVYAVIPRQGGEPLVRTATSGFQVHALVAEVVEEQAVVSSEGGNIVVKLPVDIHRPGVYTFYADLWGPGDQPIGFGQDRAVTLPVGRHTAELLFGGNVIRDSNVDGPYTVRNVRVRNVTEFPFAEAAPVGELLRTPDWKASSFGQ